MEAVFTALLTVLGTVVVAVIGIGVARVPLKDTRAQLLKDAELLPKLAPGSKAKTALERHLDSRVEELIKQELGRDDQRRAKGWVILAQIYIAMSFAAYSWWWSGQSEISLTTLREEGRVTAGIGLLFALLSAGLSYAYQREAGRLGREGLKVFQGRANLSVEDGVVFDAEIAATIEERLAGTHYGQQLAAQGITTVALDADGRIVEYHPDGTTTVLER